MEIFEKIHNTSVEEFIASISADSRDDRLKKYLDKVYTHKFGYGLVGRLRKAFDKNGLSTYIE